MDSFKLEHRGRKLDLIFSSYHLGAPSSAFGHTLFRLRGFGENRVSELFDRAIGFSAQDTSNHLLSFFWNSLIGGFYGVYSSIPYFYKIREYSDFESRDLWSYELNLKAEEVSFLLLHIWELAQTKIRYEYLGRNCAFELASVLEVVKPEWNLLSRLGFYVLPIELVRVIANTKGAVHKIEYRPSARKRFYHALDELDQKKELYSLIEGQYSTSSDPAVLDAYDQYFEYKYFKELTFKPNFKILQRRNELLASRSELPVLESASMPKASPPDQMHGISRVGFFWGQNSQGESSQSFEFRGALHDLLDPMGGPADYQQLEMFKLRAEYSEEKLRLGEFYLFSVGSYPQWSMIEKPMSFDAKAGVDRYFDLKKKGQLASFFSVGLGSSFDFFKRVKISTLFDQNLSYHPSFHRSHFRWAIGPKIQALMRLNESFSLWGQLIWHRLLVGKKKEDLLLQIKTRYTWATNHALGPEISWQKWRGLDSQLKYFFFF